MADPILQVPIRETASIVTGESLHIHFTENCCFCSDATDEYFDTPLPTGDQKADYRWKGKAIKEGTISFYHTDHGSGCHGKRKMDSGRTIIIGS